MFRNFKGTIEELIENVQKFDVDKLDNIMSEKEDIMLTDEESIDLIIEEVHCSEEEAKRILTEIKEEIVSDNLKILMERGLVEIKEYNSEGEALYGLTEDGKKYAESMKK